MRFSFFCILFITLHAIAFGCKEIKIYNQMQFDAAVERINKGEEMHLRLASGLFYLKESIQAKAPLSIKGDGTLITCYTDSYGSMDVVKTTATHNIYKVKTSFTVYPLFYAKDGRLLHVSESVIDSVGVNYIEGGIIAPEDYSSGVKVQIPISNNLKHLKNKTFAHAFGYFDSGWTVVNFSLERSDDKYFYCTTLNNCATKNYEYDSKVYKKPVRYVIYNVEVKPGAIYYDQNYLYVPKSLDEVYCLMRSNINRQEPNITTYADITLNGVQFVGFDGIKVYSNESSVCDIRKCHFQNSLGSALSIDKKTGQNLREANVNHCTFENCSQYNDMVVMLNSTYDGGSRINMQDCTITRYKEGIVGYKNPREAIHVNGNIALKDNVVYNSCRDHFFTNKGVIHVNGNVLYNTDEFNSNADRNFSSDWGLIYCNHIFKDTREALNNTTHRILLENNLLYGAYAYGGDARGIFIDDGRGDVQCKNNIILNTQLYSMDSRNVKLTDASSIRNRFDGNVIASKYRLAAGNAISGSDTPVVNGNFLLAEQENVIFGVRTEMEDVRLDSDVKCSLYNGKIHVSNDLFRLLKKKAAWKSVRRYVGKM